MVTIDELTEATPESLEALNRLLSHLSRSASPLTQTALGHILNHPTTTVLVAKDGDRWLGSLTLAVFPIPTGVRAWIEDVVVDEAARGQGIGTALSTRAVEIARSVGARTVDLTSRPSRAAANRLYQQLGFVERETNVYRLVLGSSSTD